MATSQNGWPHITKAPSYKLNHITGRVLPGDVATVFQYLGDQFHARVEPINPAHSWGWADRKIVGGNSLSNHASGTAVDFNAPAHPLGKKDTFSKPKQITIRAILAELSGILTWGADWSRPDDMHFEIKKGVTPAQVKAAVAKLKGSPESSQATTPAPATDPLSPGSQKNPNPNVKVWQEFLQKTFPGYERVVGKPLEADGWYGPITQAWTKEFQKRTGLEVDGMNGAMTQEMAMKYGYKP